VERLFIELKSSLIDLAAWFGVPAGWLPLLSAFLSAATIMAAAPVIMMYQTWFERKVVGRFQDRYGPNRVGPFGLFQPIADGVKALQKEDLVPAKADKLLHFLAPALVVVPTFMLFLFVPWGRGMVAADIDTGLLFFFAFAGLQAPIIVTAGWAPRNKFSVLGGLRAAAQVLSYGVPMAISAVAVVMAAGSLSSSAIVEAQGDNWFILTPWGAFAFVIFFVCVVAETKRTPFDMPEAESELVAGFHTEYSGLKFALFFMAEYMGSFAACMLATTLFLGGWSGPEFLPSWAIFMAKSGVLFFVMVWFRGTLPRLRIDQMLGLAWKFLFPLSLVTMVAEGLWYFLRTDGRMAGAILWPLAILAVSYWILSVVMMREFVRGNKPRGKQDAW